jgi:Tfp pilus assembly protein PilN
MRAVNLLPRDESRRAPDKKQTIAIGIATGTAVVITALVALSFLSASSKVRQERADLASLQRQVDLLPPATKGPTPEETQLVGQQKQRLAVVAQALDKRVAWDRVFRELSLVLPDDVWLTGLNAKSPQSPASTSPVPTVSSSAAAPTMFTIQGDTYSHAAVARFLSRLAVIPDLTNVQLLRSSLSKVGTQKVVQFTIAADIRAPAVASTPVAATVPAATTTTGAAS